MKKLKGKILLDTKHAAMGQYGQSDDIEMLGEFETILDHYEKYAKSIGALMISFSGMEDSVDVELATAINERAYEPGYRIIKYLEFRDKINLWKDHYSAYIKGILSGKKQLKFLAEMKAIYLKLVELSEFRNKIAHANWSSLDNAGFVRYRSVENKDISGGMSFEKVKMTPGVIIKFVRQNDAISTKINEFREKFWEAKNMESRKNYKAMEKRLAKSKNKSLGGTL